MDSLEVNKQKRLAQIESERFGHLVQSLGSDTLKEMARAGPETQVRRNELLMSFIHLDLGWMAHFLPQSVAQKGHLVFWGLGWPVWTR